MNNRSYRDICLRLSNFLGTHTNSKHIRAQSPVTTFFNHHKTTLQLPQISRYTTPSVNCVPAHPACRASFSAYYSSLFIIILTACFLLIAKAMCVLLALVHIKQHTNNNMQC